MLRLYIETITKRIIISQSIFSLKKLFKKLVSVLAILAKVIGASKSNIILDHILYIYYSAYFHKNNNNIGILIDYGSEINIITLIYTLNLSL